MKILKTLNHSSFYWMFFLILFLYGFSTRFPKLLLVIPVGLFFLYLCLNIKDLKTKIDNSFLAYITLISVFGILLFIGGIFNLDFEQRVSDASYIFLALFPLFFIFYFEMNKSSQYRIFQNLFLSYFILSILLFILLRTGFIHWNRYQHVGNCLAATSILALGIRNIKFKWIIFFILLICVLLTGSRQSLAGILFVGIIYVILNRFKLFIALLGFVLVLITNKEYFIEILSDIARKYDMFTISRLLVVFKQDGGGISIITRLEIYDRLISELTVLPNLFFSPYKKEYFPHNYFLEYSLTSGILIGFIFTLFIFNNLYKGMVKNRNNILLYLPLFYLLPFNVSSGIAASKYFLFFIILIMRINKNDLIK